MNAPNRRLVHQGKVISIQYFSSNKLPILNTYSNGTKAITYCGFGTHHQNGIAERNIRTMVEKARTALNNAHAQNDINTPID